MLHTELKQGQFIQVGDAMIRVSEINDIKGSKRVRLEIDAPKSIKIQFDKTKRQSN